MRSCIGAVVLALMARCVGLCLCAGEALRKSNRGASEVMLMHMIAGPTRALQQGSLTEAMCGGRCGQCPIV